MSSAFDPSRYVLDTVAGIIDSPSLYMGGPSRDALRKARYIVEFFQTDAIATEARRAATTKIDAVHDGAGRRHRPAPVALPPLSDKEKD